MIWGRCFISQSTTPQRRYVKKDARSSSSSEGTTTTRTKNERKFFFALGFLGALIFGCHIYFVCFLLGDGFGFSLKTHHLNHCPLSVLQIKQLGLCVTVLKQKCREFGIVRWPFRKVKKIDMLIKQLEEEKEKVVSSSSVSEKEEEPPRGLKEQQGEERGGNFVVVGAPTRKVIL